MGGRKRKREDSTLYLFGKFFSCVGYAKSEEGSKE
jgi:hypothetical protein